MAAAPVAALLYLPLPEPEGREHLFSTGALPEGILETVHSKISGPGLTFPSARHMNDQRVQRRQRAIGAALVELFHEGSHKLAFAPLVQLLRRR